MKEYDVVTSDGKKVGRIAAVTGDFYVVERGRLWKTRAPLPKRFASVDEDTRTIRAGISSQACSPHRRSAATESSIGRQRTTTTPSSKESQPTLERC